MPRPPIRWLLVEWTDGSLGVVSVKSVMNPNAQTRKTRDLTTGKLISVSVDNNEVAAKIVMSSDDRKFLEMQIHPMTLHRAQEAAHQEVYPQIYDDAGPRPNSPENGDYSASASSWTADDWSSSQDTEEEVVIKHIKSEKVKRKYTRSKQSKPQGPLLKLEPVLPNNWRINESTNNSSIVQSINGVTVHTYTTETNITDSPLQTPRRRVMMYDQQVQTDNVPLPSHEELKSLQDELQSCQKLLENTKEALLKMAPLFNVANTTNIVNETDHSEQGNIHTNNNEILNPPSPPAKVVIQETTNANNNTVEKPIKPVVLNGVKLENITAELNSSVNRRKRKNKPKPDNGQEVEMIPIGSGKTLIGKSIYDEIDWMSYTMATRKLLMAVFSRSTLATHSLTGKSSPAFHNKPQKLCLDPRKVSDIIMTVTRKCNVKENLVRNAITIKCSDENKMTRYHMNKEQNAKKPRTSRSADPYCEDFDDD